MTIQDIEQYGHSIGMYGNIGDFGKDSLYMYISKPNKSSVLYIDGEDKDFVYISRTVKIYLNKFNEICAESNDYPKNCKCHTMIEYYQKFSIKDVENIKKAMNNLVLQYKKELIAFKKAAIKEYFEDDK